MKRRLLGILLGVMLGSVCVGCGAENTTTEPTTEAVETTTTTIEQTEAPTATPEETVEPTPEATEEASEEVVTETETPEPMETPEPEQAETATTEPVTQYTYTDMSATMFAQQTVNVRDLPDVSGNKLGSLSTNDEIAITGKCNETGWYMFEYNDSVAFVSNKYVSENKVEIQQAPADNSTANTGSASGAFNEADFPTPYAIINKGGLNVYFVMGPDPDMNYNTREQCIATVGANLGIEMEYHGAGTYYFFGDYYYGGSNANGVCGLFFPYYRAANGEWLGDSPETQEQVF